MKILMVINAFPPAWQAGGPVKVAYEICRKLVKRNHEVVVYTTDVYSKPPQSKYEENPTVMEGISVYRFKNLSDILARKNMPMAIEMMPSLEKSMREFDIVHAHLYRCFQAVQVHHYARKYGVPYVLQAHGSLPRVYSWQKLKWLYDELFGYKLLRDASKVIALTQVEAEQYKHMGVPEEKIAIVPNGIDISEYAELPPKGSFKKKFNLPEDRKIILYLGRIHKTKGIDFLIRAYTQLKNEMKCRNAVLVIAGPDDGYLSEVKSLVHDLGVSNSVLFTGVLSEKDKIKAYTDASIVAYLGPFEPYGLVSLEAAVCETPVIVAQGTPMAEIVNRGKFGFSVKYGDVTSLASMLHRVLSNKELTENLGRNGRNYIFSNFGWDKIIEKYEQVYEKATNVDKLPSQKLNTLSDIK
jgi:glycosyltransferase involved in cell wall biosynthesis